MSEFSLIEARRQSIQAALDAKKSAAQRNRLGQFATPHVLAVEIARFVAQLTERDLGSVHFADPAIGTGSFFSAALSAFGRKRIKSACGVEIDPLFAQAARELWSPVGLQVVQDDFTRVVANGSRPAAPSLILANPPYVRHHHLTPADKKRLQALARRFAGVEINGLAGLYVYFVILATTWMERNGWAAWLIPSEFMDVNYGKALKHFLLERVTLSRIHRFNPDQVQFDDALVSSVVIVFRNAPPPVNHEPEFSYGGTLEEPAAIERVSARRLRVSHKWTTWPRHASNDRRASDQGDTPTLGSLFRIQRGIATGDNRFFVLTRPDATTRQLPEQYLRPILPSPRQLPATVIDPAEDGYPLIEPQLCLIDCDLPEHVVRTQYPSLWEYLATADVRGVRNGYLVNKRSPWYRQEQRLPAPFLCTYMGRGTGDKQPFRFILNRSRAIATNLYLMLYPRQPLASLLRDDPCATGTVHALLGRITGDELRGEGRVYGGGLNKIEPAELSRISALALIERWPELRNATEEVGLFG